MPDEKQENVSEPILKPQGRQPISKETVEKIRKLRTEGYNYNQIAKLAKVSYSSVSRYLLDTVEIKPVEVRPMVEKKDEKDVEINEIDKELDELEADEPKPHKKLPITEHDLDYEEEVSLSKPNTKVYVHKKDGKSNGLGILPIAILGIAGLVLGFVFLKGLFRPKGAPVQPPAKQQPAAETSPYPKGINIVS